jgi:hypothetical protein
MRLKAGVAGLMTDDFSVPGAADAFGLWPSPWNYPAPGKKYVIADIRLKRS